MKDKAHLFKVWIGQVEKIAIHVTANNLSEAVDNAEDQWRKSLRPTIELIENERGQKVFP